MSFKLNFPTIHALSRLLIKRFQFVPKGHSQRVSIYYLLISKIYPDMRPPAKLSYRSAIHKKVVFGAVRAWTLPQIQGEVGGDQEPPGNTSRYPMGSKFFLLILNHI